jgi:hypothetical protein
VDPWQIVGSSVALRREMLGLSQDQAVALTDDAVTGADWATVEAGRADAVRSQVRREISLALGWPVDAINQIAAGADPERLNTGRPSARPRTAHDGRDRVDDVDFAKLRELDPEGYHTITAQARRLLAAALEKERTRGQ